MRGCHTRVQRRPCFSASSLNSSSRRGSCRAGLRPELTTFHVVQRFAGGTQYQRHATLLLQAHCLSPIPSPVTSLLTGPMVKKLKTTQCQRWAALPAWQHSAPHPSPTSTGFRSSCNRCGGYSIAVLLPQSTHSCCNPPTSKTRAHLAAKIYIPKTQPQQLGSNNIRSSITFTPQLWRTCKDW
jgi:hypothetical protein